MVGIKGLAVFVLVVVIDVDTDNRVDAKELLIGETGVYCVGTGEVTTEGENVVGVGVIDLTELLVGESGAVREVSDGLDERVSVGERRLATDWAFVSGPNFREGGFDRDLICTGGSRTLSRRDASVWERCRVRISSGWAVGDSEPSLISLFVPLPESLEMKEASLFLVPPFSFFFLSFSPSPAIELVRDQRDSVTGGGDKRFGAVGLEI